MQVFKVVKVTEKKLGLEFYLTKLMPVGLCQALTNYFGNTSYLYLTVAFIQMLKVRMALNMRHGICCETLCQAWWFVEGHSVAMGDVCAGLSLRP